VSRTTIGLFIANPERSATWLAALRKCLPECVVEPADRFERPDDIEFAVVWGTADLGKLGRLRAVLSLGAGVDHLLRNPTISPDVPIVRMVEAGLADGMREYVLLNVLRHHRDMQTLEGNQARCRWAPFAVPLAKDRTVGVMGLGALGADAGQSLVRFGFRVIGWSRRPKTLSGIRVFTEDDRPAFLRQTEILVCLLPLTAETSDILDKTVFASLPKGAAVINAARGEHLVDADLLSALESGHLSGATLDAFRTEPLPPDHPFWRHPRITVTPHCASLTHAEGGARRIAQCIEQMRAGETPVGLVDRRAGY
jgi:glyoxylate/hydroxypyruvate reductase